MENSYKLRIKIGNAEFEAEGPTDDVKAQFEAFKELVQDLGGSVLSSGEPIREQTPSASINEADARQATPERALIQRAFAEKDGLVTLLALPKGERQAADALVLLLYGYHLLKPSEYPVTGVRLMQAAQRSGIQIDRVDRVIASNEFVLTTGFKRGKRYSLNNRGEQSGVTLMRALFS